MQQSRHGLVRIAQVLVYADSSVQIVARSAVPLEVCVKLFDSAAAGEREDRQWQDAVTDWDLKRYFEII